MCGSGTTLVEASLLGCQAFGIDMNPLSVLVSRVKCEILKMSPTNLEQCWMDFKRNVWKVEDSGKAYYSSIDPKNAAYLENWFTPEVLRQLGQIMSAIKKVKHPIFSDFLKVTLSNLLRQISWQKDSDLRVRLDKTKRLPDDIWTLYLQETETALKSVLALAFELVPEKLGAVHTKKGDARDFSTFDIGILGETDCIITSPPYATALPYLDTDRLSLYFFDLLARTTHRQTDLSMIGNREITNGQYQTYWAEFQQKKEWLSPETVELIEKIARLNTVHPVGFRRKNLPALLAKYFLDMRSVLNGCFHALRPGGKAFFVVGNNHTVAGGEKVEIPTDQLLGQLAEKSGFRWTESLSMELLISRDIFKKNAGSAETILFFQKP
jgi:site-specific DNA-methyltransferase (cytosine-N4-specific)